MDITLTLAIGATIFGAILGSFINALSFRWGSKSIWTGRSKCMHCSHILRASELVPILSYIFLRGRCSSCSSRISLQYPLVEALAALLSLGLYLRTPGLLAYGFSTVVCMTLLFICVYDLRHKIIPWGASIFLIVLAFGYILYLHPTPYNLVAGPLLALPLFLLWLCSRGAWMGLGDSVLELSLATFLGLTAGLTALVLAFWAGALVGIALIVARRGVTMRSEVPFAPFLVVGALAAYFAHVDFFQALPLLF